MDPIDELRTRVRVEHDAVKNCDGTEYSGAFASLDLDNSFSLEGFQSNFSINILEMSDDEMVFEMIGIDAPMANAFRRILIAEVPTMAIEKVMITNNTSIIHDEVLALRLGLIPIFADPEDFEDKTAEKDYNDKNSILFKLNVQCSRNPDAPDDAVPEKKYFNSNVFSRDLQLLPDGSNGKPSVRTVHEDILIAKLRPGQSIELQAYCEKGIGQTHAKWSPVATASYRLMPDVRLSGDITGEDAQRIAKMCPPKVFDIEDIGGESHLRVKDSFSCTMCRECIRRPEDRDKVKLLRIRDHFIFSIESTGALKPEVLFDRAVQVLQHKCNLALTRLHELVNQTEKVEPEDGAVAEE
eukprot:TRINITY_DN18865_c0_g1_i3.p1 TRINITY_DN18865_c0_g1~~TRINITY_DN18865_c0_g1_i3.p1  ORF type:complete len:354 (-),score=74.50 TRINITY_DN18865_c0_g1_i3:130-1191(-)